MIFKIKSWEKEGKSNPEFKEVLPKFPYKIILNQIIVCLYPFIVDRMKEVEKRFIKQI